MSPSPIAADTVENRLSLVPRSEKLPNQDSRAAPSLGDVEQAQSQDVSVDGNGHPIYYAIHFNDEFRNFIVDYGLNTPSVLRNVPAELEFRRGSVELKSAWQIVDADQPPKNYIVTQAVVPFLKRDSSGKLVKDETAKPKPVTVALLGLHVVFVLEGHPEFIWATFEHVSLVGGRPVRDVAPAAVKNPDQGPPMVSYQTDHYSLYPSGPLGSTASPVQDSNSSKRLGDIAFDEKAQIFSPVTPVYRIFPSSKSSDQGITPDEDEQVVAVNNSAAKMFLSVSSDVRSNYQLVGAVWLNTPRADFLSDTAFSDVTQGGAPPHRR